MGSALASKVNLIRNDDDVVVVLIPSQFKKFPRVPILYIFTTIPGGNY